jgi:4-hydroxybenzoate polyprenyltransferase
MTAIQFSIGALNDIVDAPRDRGRRPVKPLADGLLGPAAGRAVAVVAAALGFALSAASGAPTLAVAVAGAACGYAYDLRLSRTAIAWLPLALALPLVPVYAWLGATGSVPAGILALVPIAMLAGGGLAVGNAVADLEADAAAGASSVGVRLGRQAAWRLHALALAASAGLVAVALPPDPVAAGVGLVLAGAVVLATGIVAMALASTPARATVARSGWQVEAIGVALMGIGWVVAFVANLSAAN